MKICLNVKIVTLAEQIQALKQKVAELEAKAIAEVQEVIQGLNLQE